jgi:hypothetical protein
MLDCTSTVAYYGIRKLQISNAFYSTDPKSGKATKTSANKCLKIAKKDSACLGPLDNISMYKIYLLCFSGAQGIKVSAVQRRPWQRLSTFLSTKSL